MKLHWRYSSAKNHCCWEVGMQAWTLPPRRHYHRLVGLHECLSPKFDAIEYILSSFFFLSLDMQINIVILMVPKRVFKTAFTHKQSRRLHMKFQFNAVSFCLFAACSVVRFFIIFKARQCQIAAATTKMGLWIKRKKKHMTFSRKKGYLVTIIGRLWKVSRLCSGCSNLADFFHLKCSILLHTQLYCQFAFTIVCTVLCSLLGTVVLP